MNKVKVTDLVGTTLEWAVAKAEGKNPTIYKGACYVQIPNISDPDLRSRWGYKKTAFSTSWAQGGPIIERERVGLCYHGQNELLWAADIGHGNHLGYGPTPLIAAMRCFVASKLGDEVDIPDEILA